MSGRRPPRRRAAHSSREPRFSPELELIFLLAGTSARRAGAQERIAELLEAVDFKALGDALAQRRLLPLFGPRIEHSAPGASPREFGERVEAETARARARGVAVEALTRRLTDVLEGAGIAALELKGSSLAVTIHGDVALRSAGDVDLLVRREDLGRAIEVLTAQGYEVSDDAGANALPSLHYVLAHDELPPVELHWRVSWYEEAFSRDLLERSEADADGTRRATPTDELAALLLFFARDGFYGLRLAADIGAWWDRHEPGDVSGLLDSHVARYSSLTPALRAAAVAAELFTGVPARGLLSTAGRLAPRERGAVRLANWSQVGEPDQLMANISLVDGLLAPAGGVGGFIRRQLLLPDAEIADLSGLRQAGKGRLRAARGMHATKMLGRYTIALWRIRGGRPWMPVPAGSPV